MPTLSLAVGNCPGCIVSRQVLCCWEKSSQQLVGILGLVSAKSVLTIPVCQHSYLFFKKKNTHTQIRKVRNSRPGPAIPAPSGGGRLKIAQGWGSEDMLECEQLRAYLTGEK